MPSTEAESIVNDSDSHLCLDSAIKHREAFPSQPREANRDTVGIRALLVARARNPV